MRGRFWMAVIAAGVLGAVACGPIDFGWSTSSMSGLSRLETMSGDKTTDGKGNTDEGPRMDTTIYMSALVFPEGYDWRRDTAYSNSGAVIVLYRNGENVLSLKTGTADRVGDGVNMHHLISGRIVTEHVGSGGTTVKLDGEVLFNSSKSETLAGLLFKDSELYSLSRKKNGRGFTLRKGETTILDNAEGELFGSMGEDCHFRGGALYTDKDQICFAYKTQQSAHLYIDGEDCPITSVGEILDLRRIDGETCILSMENGRLRMTIGLRSSPLGNNGEQHSREGHLSKVGGDIVAIYEYLDRSQRQRTCMSGIEGALRDFSGSCTFVGNAEGDGYGIISHDEGEKILAVDCKGQGSYLPEDALWLGPRACCTEGDELLLSCTPFKIGEGPLILRHGVINELKINGIVTSVECIVSHSRR